ncbi:MAG: flagellar basal body P-ring formation protein FlgA [Proteobacteria bacterium]|nr:flagellar basal body P-ring formation protein FlgA [Pseudomonadota bacterium]HQR05110.1 flagellar basal body P-ring formation chaperone FlgA [Rhodocyclaceae bacterium]
MRSFLICLALLSPISGIAAPAPAPNTIRQAVEVFLREQTRNLPGKVSIEVGSVDAATQLPACSSPEIGLPPGARAWGRTTVQVQCRDGAGWTQYVAAQVRVEGHYIVAARPLPQGHLLTAEDLLTQTGDITDLASNAVLDPTQALGKTLTAPLAAGRPLRSDYLRQPPVVLQGQNVKVLSRGPGFQVSNEGQALNNGANGQVVRVRLSNGQIVSGLARAGAIVEVGY